MLSDGPERRTEGVNKDPGLVLALFDKGPQWISAPKPRKEIDPKSYLKSFRFV